MIPTSLFIVLTILLLIIILYFFLERQGWLCSDILAGFSATFLSLYLGLQVAAGNVGDIILYAPQQIVINVTNLTNITSPAYEFVTIPLLDAGLGWGYIIVCLIMAIFTMVSTAEFLLNKLREGDLIE